MEHFKKQGAKFVQRLDGIGVKDPKNPFASINYQTHQEVNAAIFQSRFCLEVWEKTFGVGKPSCIVLNGADEKVFSREGKKNDFGFKRLMVTAARWREWKNLDQVIEVFEALDDKDLGLAVIGEGAEVPKHPRILAPGRLSHRRMAEVFRAADLFIYLPWYEWCPKVVAQALVTGLPVLCSYNGGTRELVRDCGRAVRGEKDAGLEYFYRNPVDLKEAVKAAGELLEKHERVKPRPDLYASKMVEGYFKVFEQALENARP
jgi:glycosyltransferase involved in cell wall biosynthesis